MARSKEPSLETIVRDAVQSAGVSRKDALLVGVSGGVDSMVLATILHTLQKKRVFSRLAVAHVDHGLRGRESDADRDLVLSFAASKGIECFVESLDVARLAARAKVGIEEAGRNERYRYFRQIAEVEGFQWIVTAHHVGDVFESILMNIARGTGIRGLVGVPATRALTPEIMIVRPMITATRSQIEVFAKTCKIYWRDDVSNRGDAYTRNRIRNEVVPALKRAMPQYDLNRAAERLSAHTAEIVSYLYDEALKLRRRSRIIVKGRFFIAEANRSFKLSVLRRAAPILVRELLRIEFETAVGQPCSIDTIVWKRIMSMIETGKPSRIQLSKELRISVTDNIFSVEPSLPIRPLRETLPVGATHITDVGTISLRRTHHQPEKLDADSCMLPAALESEHGLLIRLWRPSDRMQPFGMKGSKLVSDILLEAGVRSIDQKRRFPLISLVDDPKAVVWVPGIRASELCRIRSDSETALLLSRKLF